MAETATCNDPKPHGPHIWYEPDPAGGKQKEYQCPGVK